MIDRNLHGETICDWSDLPTSMCAHCQSRQTQPTNITTVRKLEQTAGHPIPTIRARIKRAPLTCPHPHPNTQPLCDTCTRQKSSTYTGTPNHPLQQLAEIPDLAADVEATRNHKNPVNTENQQHTTHAPAVPADLETLDCLRTDNKGLLHKLQQALTDINPETQPANTWQQICDQLRHNQHHWTPATRHTIHKVHTQLRIAARIPKPLQLACPRCHAPIHLQPGGQYYLCENSHQVNHWAEIDRMARQTLYTTPITLAQAATEYGIPLWTLKRLMRRIPPAGKQGNARTWTREQIEEKLAENARKNVA